MFRITTFKKCTYKRLNVNLDYRALIIKPARIKKGIFKYIDLAAFVSEQIEKKSGKNLNSIQNNMHNSVSYPHTCRIGIRIEYVQRTPYT